jgi:hypothetical protein
MKEWVFVKSVYQPSPTLTGFKTSMSTNKSTPENAGAKQQAWVKTLRHEIVDKIDQQMSNLLASLPMAYFEGLSEDDQLAHLKALMAFKICDIKQAASSRWTKSHSDFARELCWFSGWVNQTAAGRRPSSGGENLHVSRQ